MSRAPEKFRYLFRYVFVLMGLVAVAALAVIVSLYFAQKADRKAHDRVTFFHREVEGLSDRIRRENRSLLRSIGYDIPTVAEAAPADGRMLGFRPDARGTLQVIEAKLVELQDLHRQHDTGEFAATLARINDRFRAVERSILDSDSVEEMRNAILIFDLAIEQLYRQHLIAAETVHPDVDSVLARMTPHLSIITLILVLTGAAAWMAMRSLHKSIVRQVEMEDALAKNTEHMYHLEKLESLGRLVGGIAHDFNNLLTAILGQAGLLREKNPDASTQEGLAQIQEAGRQAAALTKQLLNFGRPAAMDVQVVDVNKIIGDTESMLARTIGEEIELQIDYADDLFPVRMNPGQLQQVIVNLVINARDAMPDGGQLSIATRNVHVESSPHDVNAAPVGRYAKIVVADTGTGMAEDVRQRVFEPYFTTKEMGQGTGLGLATAYGIIKAAQGRIDVSSRPGIGTRFEILLPRASGTQSQPVEQPDAAGGLSGNETVLAVEDDEQIRAFLKAGLESLGYRVLLAKDAAEGLELCSAGDGRIDVILADVVLPEMDGTELLARARELQPHARSILMSGYTDDVFERTAIDENDCPLVHKPFEIGDIARVIRERLAGSPKPDKAALAS